MELVNRVIGISSEDFRKIPLIIGVAGGEGKHLAVKLALQAGILDIAVIDENKATYLLNE